MTTDPNDISDDLPDDAYDGASFADEIELTAEEKAAAAAEMAGDDHAEASDAYASTDETAALKEEIAAVREQMMRALADADNTRKRAIKEREDASKFAVSKFAKDLLDVADNLRRAIDAIPDDLKAVDPRIEGIIGGIEATERELLKSFDKNNIVKIEPLDEQFDPNFHEVMFEAPMPGKAGGTIIQVVEAGYVLNGRLLRAAKVGLAKAEDTDSPAPAGDNVTHIDTEA